MAEMMKPDEFFNIISKKYEGVRCWNKGNTYRVYFPNQKMLQRYLKVDVEDGFVVDVQGDASYKGTKRGNWLFEYVAKAYKEMNDIAFLCSRIIRREVGTFHFKTLEKEILGELNVCEEKIAISDPDLATDEHGCILNMSNGTWEVARITGEYGETGIFVFNRTKYKTVENALDGIAKKFIPLQSNIAVDSGTIGFWTNNERYLIDEEYWIGEGETCFVTKSGGDGIFLLYTDSGSVDLTSDAVFLPLISQSYYESDSFGIWSGDDE